MLTPCDPFLCLAHLHVCRTWFLFRVCLLQILVANFRVYMVNEYIDFEFDT